MRNRWGLGPVFALEWLTTSRRRQTYAVRMMFVGFLLAALASVWVAQVMGRPINSIHEQAEVGRSFFFAIVNTQFVLILVVAPSTMAGAICQDKERGNLLPMLLTDLSDAEIVLGKLAGRLVPLVEMVGCSLPVLALGSFLGGIDPASLFGALAVGVSVAILCGSIALAFSTWGTRTQEVVLATMGVEAIWLLALPIWGQLSWLWNLPRPPRWACDTGPFDLALGPYHRPDQIGWVDYVGFCGSALAISLGLIALSVARMRSVAVAGMDGPRSKRAASKKDDRMARLDRDPAGWYERHRRQPTPWMRTMIGTYFGFAGGFGLLAVVDGLRPANVGSYGWFPAYVVAFASAIGLPLILLTAATSMVEERTRGSLDILLATPISTRRIVLAKWWAAFRQVGILLPIPSLVILPLAWTSGQWWLSALVPVSVVAWAASASSVGLALAIWLARPSRAVAAAVSLYLLVSLGWPVAVIAQTDRNYGTWWGLTTVSPFYSGFCLTSNLGSTGYYPGTVAWASLRWMLLHALAAGLLLLLTMTTFDRALGRMPERRERPDHKNQTR